MWVLGYVLLTIRVYFLWNLGPYPRLKAQLFTPFEDLGYRILKKGEKIYIKKTQISPKLGGAHAGSAPA